MRALQRLCLGTSVRASTLSLRCLSQEGCAPVPRSAVLARWTGTPAVDPDRASTPTGLVGKGMHFASGLLRDVSQSTRTASTNAAADSTIGDVPWDLCERMDFYVQYNIPSSWHVTELLRDNSIAIQCSPPALTGSSSSSSMSTSSSSSSGGRDNGGSESAVHGISLNCFAYKQRVKQLDSSRLLHVFLKRFNASVGNSLELIAEGKPPATAADVAAGAVRDEARAVDAENGYVPPKPEDADGTCQMLAKQLSSAVAEISFTPAPGQPLAHGLCRAFYNSNGRFHYVIVVAVPAEEYATSLDLMVHALASVVESRVEAAAKRM